MPSHLVLEQQRLGHVSLGAVLDGAGIRIDPGVGPEMDSMKNIINII